MTSEEFKVSFGALQASAPKRRNYYQRLALVHDDRRNHTVEILARDLRSAHGVLVTAIRKHVGPRGLATPMLDRLDNVVPFAARVNGQDVLRG